MDIGRMLIGKLFGRPSARRARCKIGGEDGACCDACAKGADTCPCEGESPESRVQSQNPALQGALDSGLWTSAGDLSVPIYATTGEDPAFEQLLPQNAGPVFELKIKTFRTVDPKTGEVAWLAAGTVDGPMGRGEFFSKADEKTMRALYGVGRDLAERLARKRAIRSLVDQAEGACASDCEKVYRLTG